MATLQHVSKEGEEEQKDHHEHYSDDNPHVLGVAVAYAPAKLAISKTARSKGKKEGN